MSLFNLIFGGERNQLLKDRCDALENKCDWLLEENEKLLRKVNLMERMYPCRYNPLATIEENEQMQLEAENAAKEGKQS